MPASPASRSPISRPSTRPPRPTASWRASWLRVVPSPDPVLDTPDSGVFRVALSNFDGPFDLLLTLIGKRELDITEIALSAVTDEFLEYLRGLDAAEEMDRASEFIVVAATLLDLKIAGLLPQGELVDAEDVALLEARDLLFARLLQYRAFKEAARWFEDRLRVESERHPRSVRLEEKFRESTPELHWTLGVQDFAALALVALTPREIPTVGLDHLHAPLVSIREQAAHLVAMLRGGEPMSFRRLISGVTERGIVVARFLALLELYRHAAVSFEQIEPLGELTVTWSAADWNAENLANLGADYDN
ncbi:segregation/condensation protein A [Mycetocola tolaasinivorans]|uniref:Segregation and condensation protein A n=1 Tax=Mycetocola tolaasinivorans TaxID=76635 RepID=A0A3L7A004_9MICO|nr:segregation/condensation protein A [Mycetocola tolaasinivorans]